VVTLDRPWRGLVRGWLLAVRRPGLCHKTAGVLTAWWRERIGGIVLLVIALAHGTFALISSGHNRGFAVLISGGPFLLIGLLFLASWRRRSSQGAS
jgi:MYXO-CTERM domain-containing protein